MDGRMLHDDADILARSLSTSPASAALECLPGLFHYEEDESAQKLFFSETSHALHVLEALNEQRRQRVLCDVIICVEDKEFACHRSVLAAGSPYFFTMFSTDMRESLEQRVTVSGTTPAIMEQLINYAYTANITISQENAQHLLSAANMVQMGTIRDACCAFMEREMNPANCIGIYCFAEAHVCDVLSAKARSFAMENFSEVAQHDELLCLPCSTLVDLIASDELTVTSEEVVFQAVINWVKYDPTSRLPSLAEVLHHVRLSFVSPYFLFDKIDTEALLSKTTECRRYLDEAKKYHILKDRRIELQSDVTRPRRCQATDRRIIMVGGEIHSKNYLNSVDGYSLDEGKWLRLKDLPFPRCHHGCTVSDGTHLYVTGGLNRDNVVLNNVLRYEPTLDKWIKMANMNKSRARHAMAALDGCVYVLGGSDGEKLMSSVERYTPAINQWQSIASLPIALSRCQAVGSSGQLYIAGGTSVPNNYFVAMLYQYSPHDDVWNTLSPMPVPRCLLTLAAVGSSLYAVGGAEEPSRASSRLSRYDIKCDKWTDLAAMGEPRYDAGVTSIDNKIYVLSGHDGENSFHHNIEEYDIATDTWAEMSTTTVPYGRCRFGCVALRVPSK